MRRCTQRSRVAMCMLLESSLGPAMKGIRFPTTYSTGCAYSAEMETSYWRGILVTL